MTGRERFKRALRRETTDVTPVWFMRQAGRFLPEYREIRQKYDFLTSCQEVDLIVEITLQPIRRLDVDAAIVFSDILLPLRYAGFDFDIIESKGPVIHHPITKVEDVERFTPFDPHEQMPFLEKALKELREELGDEKALIGFGGAPFTLASYLIEGGGSRDHRRTKKFMHQHPEAWHKLMSSLTDILIKNIQFQASCGIDAFQIFDSWAGSLSPADYRDFVLPYLKRAIESVQVPIINFSTGTSGFIHLVASAGGDVVGVDWRIPIGDAWEKVGPDRGIQGNLDPAVLLTSKEAVRKHVEEILSQTRGKNGHIFNLGHGILPDTPVENVLFTIELVRSLSSS